MENRPLDPYFYQIPEIWSFVPTTPDSDNVSHGAAHLTAIANEDAADDDALLYEVTTAYQRDDILPGVYAEAEQAAAKIFGVPGEAIPNVNRPTAHSMRLQRDLEVARAAEDAFRYSPLPTRADIAAAPLRGAAGFATHAWCSVGGLWSNNGGGNGVASQRTTWAPFERSPRVMESESDLESSAGTAFFDTDSASEAGTSGTSAAEEEKDEGEKEADATNEDELNDLEVSMNLIRE